MENDKLLEHVALEQAELLGSFKTFREEHGKQHKDQGKKTEELAAAVRKVEDSCATMAIAINGHNQSDKVKESANKTLLAIITTLAIVGATVGGIISQIVIAHGG